MDKYLGNKLEVMLDQAKKEQIKANLDLINAKSDLKQAKQKLKNVENRYQKRLEFFWRLN